MLFFFSPDDTAFLFFVYTEGCLPQFQTLKNSTLLQRQGSKNNLAVAKEWNSLMFEIVVKIPE